MYVLKKLLILGGSSAACNIVNKARDMGIYTIVIDSFQNSPAREISDEGYQMNVDDVDRVVEFCKEKSINGVITGYVDSYLIYYYKICKKLGLPCYTMPELILITTNKRKLKQACIDNGIQVIPEYHLTNNLLKHNIQKIEYPVLVKPVDNQGSRGISICYNEKALKTACYKALEFSTVKDYLIEKYIEAPSVNMLYTLDNGNVMLEAIMDRRANNTQKNCAKLAEALLFPSIYLNLYLEKYNNKIIEMIKKLGFKNGVIFLQTFFDGKDFLIYEMGHRLPGTQTYKLVEKCCYYSPMERLINFALTGTMSKDNEIISVSPSFNNKKAVILICLLHEGTIKTIEGMEDLKNIPEVVAIDQKHFSGDTVYLVGTMQQIMARIFIVADDVKSIANAINKISKSLRIYDTNGNNQLLKLYDGHDLFDWADKGAYNL